MAQPPYIDALVQIAFVCELVAKRHPINPKLAIVTSRKDPSMRFYVTRTTCTCSVHRVNGICMHRALACYLADNGKLPFRQPIPITEQE